MVLLLLVLFYGNHCFIFQRKGLKISTYLENSSEVLTTWLFLSVLWVFKSLFLQCYCWDHLETLSFGIWVYLIRIWLKDSLCKIQPHSPRWLLWGNLNTIELNLFILLQVIFRVFLLLYVIILLESPFLWVKYGRSCVKHI